MRSKECVLGIFQRVHGWETTALLENRKSSCFLCWPASPAELRLRNGCRDVTHIIPITKRKKKNGHPSDGSSLIEPSLEAHESVANAGQAAQSVSGIV